VIGSLGDPVGTTLVTAFTSYRLLLTYHLLLPIDESTIIISAGINVGIRNKNIGGVAKNFVLVH